MNRRSLPGGRLRFVCEEAAIPTIPVNGIELFYEARGEGEALLLLGGFGCDHSYWDPLVPALAARFRLVLPDNRGCGRTRSSGAFTARDLAADAAALLKALGVAKARVAGVSFGGQVAQELALEHPGKVASLALISTSAKSSVRLAEVVDTAARMAVGSPPDVCVRAFLPWVFTEKFFETPGALDAAVSRIMANPNPPSPEGLLAQSAAIAAFDSSSRVGEIRCPTLVLAGAEDILVPASHSRGLAAKIAGATLEVLDSGAHDLVHERPEAVCAALLSFLSPAGRQSPARS